MNEIKKIIIFVWIFEVIVGCQSAKSDFPEVKKIFQDGNYEMVVKKINAIQKRRTLKSEERELRADAHLKMGLIQLAINDYRLNENSKIYNIGQLSKLGDSYFALKKLDSARYYYNEILKLDPINWETYNKRGVTYLSQGALKSATNDFLLANKLNKQDIRPLINLGIASEKARNYQLAIMYYSKATRINSNSDKIYFSRGVSYMYLEKFDKAIQDFNKAISLNDSVGNYFLNRGMAFFLLKKKGLACEDWEHAVLKGDDSAKNYLMEYCN